MQEVNLVKNAWLGVLAGALILVGCGSGGDGGANGSSGTTTTSSSSSGTNGQSGSTSTGVDPSNTGNMSGANGPAKTIAFVTNNPSQYWTIARKGVDKAQKELAGKFNVQFVMLPENSAATQKSKMDDLITNGVAGIAVSPVNPDNQTPDLNNYAGKTTLITTDSDAPNSKRACYVGADNTAAGVMAGEALKKALPNGGKVEVFVGDADAANAKERFNGLKQALQGTKIQIIDLRTDQADHARAKQNVSDALVRNPDLAACVGLWSYNGPAIYNAVKEAGKQGKVQIVCFDQEDDTLAGIKDGTIYATVVQQPFEYGYQSMILLSKILGGDKKAIPDSKRIIIDTKIVDKSNIDAYSADLKKLTGAG